ncbi:transcriptional regulator [Algimonas porphyrae]|uniref:Transcriptional regulator n=2 Tax=Algimonas porphyrae TaxID=1128113 RepID=A0ABQ5V031_9PROT|nr:transcriptional regulator [Algimonas porphyrae]
MEGDITMTSKHAPRSANPVDVHVGARVRLRRQVMKMSQEKLGDQLGVTFQQVQKYERGTNRVGASRLWRLSQVLEVPVSYFFEGMTDQIEAGEFGENDQMPIVYDFINSSDGVALAKAVSQIKNKAVRRQILELARSLAKDSAAKSD